MMGLKIRIDTPRLEPSEWMKLSSRIVSKICSRRDCRIGFRQGILIEVEGMVMELMYIEDDYAKLSFLEIECVAHNVNHLVICFDSALKASELILQEAKKGDGDDNRKSGSI